MLDGECTTDALPSPPRTEKFFSPNANKTKPKVSKSDKSDNEKDETFKNTHPPLNQNVIYISHAGHIQFGNIINIGTTKSEQHLRRPVEEDEQIRSLKNSSNPVTSKDNNLISNYIGKDWKDVARALGYEDPEMDQFEYPHPKSLKEIVYSMLRSWMEMHGPHEAKVGVLAQRLWESKQEIAVKKWSEKYEKLHV